MYREFAKLRKENKFNWLIRNIKLINWLVFAVFALLVFIGIILIAVKSIQLATTFINLSNEVSNAWNETGVYILKNNIDSVLNLMNYLNIFFIGLIGIIVARIIANGCLIYRNYLDYKKINISKNFFMFRNIMLSILILIIVILLFIQSIGIYNNFMKWIIDFTNENLNYLSDITNVIIDIGFDNSGNSLNPVYVSDVLIPEMNIVANNITTKLQEFNQTFNTTIAILIVWLVFFIVWAIYDIIYGSITLVKSRKALMYN